MKIVAVFLILFSSLIISVQSRAQEMIPVSQQNVYFYYQEIGLVGKNEPNILLIGTHLYRLRERDEVMLVPIDGQLETRFGLGFQKLLDKIENDERITVANEYLGFKGDITASVEAFYDGIGSKSAGPELYRNFDNTTDHALAMREKLIADYRSAGYRILQVDTRPYLAGELTGDFIDYVDFIYPLSPLEIEVYHTGRIREILERGLSKNTKNTSRQPESGKKKEFSLIESCVYAKERVRTYIMEAQRKPSLDRWTRAKTEYENFLAGCGTTVVTIPEEWKNQIAAGYATAFAVDGVKTVYTAFTTVPWSYGYGLFPDAENQTYFHRIGFGGMAGAHNGSVVSVQFSLIFNVARLPEYKIYYGFEDEAGRPRNSVSDVGTADNLGFTTISLGPQLAIWPQRNIFIRATPEVHLGFNNGRDLPVAAFTGFPGVFTEGGIRIGIVYLSAGVGTLWKAYDVDTSSSYAREQGVVESGFSGTVYGNWVVESFDEGKMRKHRYFVFTLGLDL